MLAVPRWAPDANALIDWDHPLAQGLQRFCVPAGGTMIDLVTGRRLTPYASSLPTQGVTAFGDSLQSAGNGSGAYIAQPTVQWPASFMWCGGLVGTPPASDCGLCAVIHNVPGSGETPWYIHGIGVHGTASDARFHLATSAPGGGAGTYEGTVNGAALSGRQNVIVATAAVGACDLYQNGLRTAGNATNPTAVISGSADTYFAVNTYTNAGRNSQGSCSAAAYWWRRLSANEVAMLTADPFCMLTEGP